MLHLHKKLELRTSGNAQAGSVMIISLFSIVGILSFLALAIDMSYEFSVKNKINLGNDLAALAAIQYVQLGESTQSAETISKTIAASNYSALKINSYENSFQSLDSRLRTEDGNLNATVSYSRAYKSWFSNLLGNYQQHISQQSVAALGLSQNNSGNPLHVVLITSATSFLRCQNELFKLPTGGYSNINYLADCNYNNARLFAANLLKNLRNDDYLTLITYSSLAKIVFKKLQVTEMNRKYIEKVFSELKSGYYGPENQNLDSISVDVEPYFGFRAAKTVLDEDSADNIKHAIILNSEMAIWDFELMTVPTNASTSHFFEYYNRYIDIMDGSWFYFQRDEYEAFLEKCSVRPAVDFVDTLAGTGAGEEMTASIIAELQEKLDLRVYTVPTAPLDPDGALEYSFYDKAHSYNYAVQLANDPSYPLADRKNIIKCSERPAKKSGRYFPYTTDYQGVAKELTANARNIPAAYGKFYSKPTLLAVQK